MDNTAEWSGVLMPFGTMRMNALPVRHGQIHRMNNAQYA